MQSYLLMFFVRRNLTLTVIGPATRNQQPATLSSNFIIEKASDKLKARVAYLEQREAKLSEEAIRELVGARTKTLQQTISQKSHNEKALQDKIKALKKEGDDLREAKGKLNEDVTRLRTGRDDARTDTERIRAERDALKGKADSGLHEASAQKARADLMEKLTEQLLARSVTAEVRLAKYLERNTNADETEKKGRGRENEQRDL